MKIAIIGTGISALSAAHRLHPHHDITLYEANDYIGGHTHTIDLTSGGKSYAVDTGFIVFNHLTYPGFTRLLDELGVASQLSSMSFSVKCEQSGLEYNGTNLNSLFAQRRNLASPRFWLMIRDILRFNKRVKQELAQGRISPDESLGSYLKRNRFGKAFTTNYIIPMGAAIWSAGEEQMLAFPLRFFVDFFNNHGMLNVDDRPQWRVVKGGSRTYVEALIAPFRERILLNDPVFEVRRFTHGVDITSRSGKVRYDEVVFACHSDQALRMLADPTDDEKDILGNIGYQENEAVVHTDASVLPKRKLAWAAWNYHIQPGTDSRVAVTYNMNILQGLDAPDTFCVTLNHTESIDPDKILARFVYHHPIFSLPAVEAQKRHHLISDRNRTHYAGAYWFYGFHEDGLRSGQRVARQILERSHVEAVSA